MNLRITWWPAQPVTWFLVRGAHGCFLARERCTCGERDGRRRRVRSDGYKWHRTKRKLAIPVERGEGYDWEMVQIIMEQMICFYFFGVWPLTGSGGRQSYFDPKWTCGLDTLHVWCAVRFVPRGTHVTTLRDNGEMERKSFFLLKLPIIKHLGEKNKYFKLQSGRTIMPFYIYIYVTFIPWWP